MSSPCPHCKGQGFGAYLSDASGLDDFCPVCNGSGEAPAQGEVDTPTSPATVPSMPDPPRRALWTPAERFRPAPDLAIEVEILGTRTQFGRTDYLIRPTTGEGEVWVQAHTLKIDGEPADDAA